MVGSEKASPLTTAPAAPRTACRADVAPQVDKRKTSHGTDLGHLERPQRGSPGPESGQAVERTSQVYRDPGIPVRSVQRPPVDPVTLHRAA